MKTICLAPVNSDEQANFDISQLTGKKYYRVTRIVKRIKIKAGEAVIVEYDEGELADPSTDPLIIGTVVLTDGREEKKASDGYVWEVNPKDPPRLPQYLPRILWNNKLWRTLDEGTTELYDMMSGIKATDVRKFAEKLRQSGGNLPGVRIQPPGH